MRRLRNLPLLPLAVLLLMLLGVVLWRATRRRPAVPPQEAPAWPPPDFSTDAPDLPGLAVPMPETAQPGIKRPPCDKYGTREEEHNGGCWLRLVQRPPCGRTYEKDGACFVPVMEMPRPPVSGQREK